MVTTAGRWVRVPTPTPLRTPEAQVKTWSAEGRETAKWGEQRTAATMMMTTMGSMIRPPTLPPACTHVSIDAVAFAVTAVVAVTTRMGARARVEVRVRVVRETTILPRQQ
jgi:hypothetical protein